MADPVERTERLLNLVICLMATTTAVPRAAIRAQIPGYMQAASDSAFERMFERDKDELRSMGIPVETVVDASGEVRGYRIPQEDYALQGLDLTLAERSAVVVGAQVWGQALIAPLAGSALRKLQSVDAEGWTAADIAGAVQLTASDAALLPLLSAIRLDRTVVFDYRTPADEEAQRRTVSPWGLRSSEGAWFLVGFDHDRGAPRTFRLSRMTGVPSVTATARAERPPAGFDVRSLPAAEATSVSVRARVEPGRAASLRRRSAQEDRWTAAEIVFDAASADEAAALVCACGPDAVALEPPSVVDAVRDALTAVLQGAAP